jgi:DNA-3-methyladenine glycosylase I
MPVKAKSVGKAATKLTAPVKPTPSARAKPVATVKPTPTIAKPQIAASKPGPVASAVATPANSAVAPAAAAAVPANTPAAAPAAPARQRCAWCLGSEHYMHYHDTEWGVPVHGDRRLFELLVLEGAQAGLSWATILGKREAYRQAFAEFEPGAVARFDENDVERLMNDAGIVRNRAKIEATIENARAFMAIQKEFGTFDSWIWRFVGKRPLVNRWRHSTSVPARTRTSDRMSEELGKRGFKFVGSTICYAFMQATGMVNDHLVSCFRYRDLV